VQRRFSANSVVVNQEDTADRLYLLTNGRGRHFYITEEGRKILLHSLTPGDIFGSAALLSTPSHYLVSIEMQQDSWLLIWDRATIRRLAARFPRLLDNVLEIAAYRYLSWYVAAHAALTCSTARQRLANALASLADGTGHKIRDGIELQVSNEDLANTANITPFTASRLLNEWQRSGALSKTRGRILLRSPERLFSH
jgi:CRP/FNR family transcriptional regulator, nitrogen oxide reductase regulator